MAPKTKLSEVESTGKSSSEFRVRVVRDVTCVRSFKELLSLVVRTWGHDRFVAAAVRCQREKEEEGAGAVHKEALILGQV